ncbi:MAG: hypothetical protein ACK41D_09250 [Rubricoccaceae bacterium]
MKTLALLIALGALVSGCSLLEDDGDGARRPRHFPDGTPFIVGVIEATPDTAAFYGPPEAFVGTIIDPMSGRFLPERDPNFFIDNAIWSPTLYGQVVKLANQAHFLPVADNGATVTMTGPLGRPTERTVTLQLRNHGVYADLQGALDVVAGARYRMDVTRSDGKRYTATGSVPTLPEWTVPETTLVNTRIHRDNRGHTEMGLSEEVGGWRLSPDANMTVTQTNYENDREIFLLDEGEQFFHWQRGNYRRAGGQYAIHMRDREPPYIPAVVWAQHCSFELTNSTRVWLRLSQIGAELEKMYTNEHNETSRMSDDGHEQFVRRLWGNDGFGPRYAEWLFSLGNIEALDGGLRPFGVFGGYSSIYRTTVMKAVRNYEIPSPWLCRR